MSLYRGAESKACFCYKEQERQARVIGGTRILHQCIRGTEVLKYTILLLPVVRIK